MALTACRECAHEVSTEATACPHCGVDHPGTQTVPEPFKAPGPHQLWILAAVFALGLGMAGWQWWQHRGIEASGDQLEQTIVERFSNIAGTTVTLYATCPDTVHLRKGKIVDCSLERSDTGKTTQVFITPTDNGGHFQMQVSDPSVLIPKF